MYETAPIAHAHEMQRSLGRRLQRELQNVADEKLPDDIASLLRKIALLPLGKQQLDSP
ncbi:MAG: hypothetical protein H7Y02_10870 [Candidatus Obscuribacterales bacterium]|nr:hypothetical protein [Steroidobacteraceae bacterium]